MEEANIQIGSIELIRIPADEFLMGSDGTKDRGALEREFPQHCVYVSEFYIGKYPVTNMQYNTFVKATQYKPPADWRGGEFSAGKADHPVVHVMWDDAVAFCDWLSQESGRHFRLPTEAEWEKAARGADGRRYSWGDIWSNAKLNSHAQGPGETTAVDQYSPASDSPYGVADMCGNVWEWCADWFEEAEYQRRAAASVKDPQGPKQGSYRVQRGGSCWADPQWSARCAFRDHYSPFNSKDYNGFRVVCEL